jgi:hypothetical protein
MVTSRELLLAQIPLSPPGTRLRNSRSRKWSAKAGADTAVRSLHLK